MDAYIPENIKKEKILLILSLMKKIELRLSEAINKVRIIE